MMKSDKKNGTELGGVIENDEKNYPQTGEWSEEKPEVLDKCIGCGQCAKFCPEDALIVKEVEGKRKVVVDFRYCKGCKICEEICPLKAVKF